MDLYLTTTASTFPCMFSDHLNVLYSSYQSMHVPGTGACRDDHIYCPFRIQKCFGDCFKLMLNVRISYCFHINLIGLHVFEDGSLIIQTIS